MQKAPYLISIKINQLTNSECRIKRKQVMYIKKTTVALYLLSSFFQAYRCSNSKQHQSLQPVPAEGKPNPNALQPRDTTQRGIAVGSVLNKKIENRQKRIDGVQPKNKTQTNIPVDFDISNEIEHLRSRADQKRGINWSFQDDALVRNATNPNGVIYASEDYAVQIMSIYRAAGRLCELYGTSGQKFNRLAKKFIDRFKNEQDTYSLQSEDFWINEVKRINKATIDRLQILFPDQSRTELNKNIRMAENYAGMEDRHYNITTQFNVGNKLFALHDQKWLKLTEAQRNEFKNRKSKGWYKSLPEFEQKLVDRYLEKFLDGTHYFPTQIRKLPGCRNAYKKSVLAYDENKKPIVLGTYAHLGTLASLVENQSISEEISRANWEQIGTQMHPESDLKVVCLNHRKDIESIGYIGEKQIVDQTKRIVGDASFSCFPINLLGTLTTSVFKQPVQDLLAAVTTVYANQYPAITDLLTQHATERSKTVVQNTLAAIPNTDDQWFFDKLYALKEAAERSDFNNKVEHNLSVNDNYYADLSANYAACKARLDIVQGKTDASVAICCKSGKDRTGYSSFLVDTKLIEANLSRAANTDSIHRALAGTGHFQLLSGLNGGMPGRFGIKGGGIRKSRAKVHDALFRPSANLTNVPA